ncbi:hypothetical protein K7432_008603 [Basidiobolus ranarum]|uniref:Uncharacterized protein n=1 Tax=Basidiobolus ranarum TaxID=34480 RepID=A0ABR2WRT0_9FUNG
MRSIALVGKGLWLVSIWSSVSALNIGDTCVPNNNVQIHEKGPCQNYTLACDPTYTVCQLKGCKFNESPFGWPLEWQMPPSCNTDLEYCPNDQLKCEPKIKTGDVCATGRDDSCAEKESVCLGQRCTLKNIPLNQPCNLDNTTVDSISRDNCGKGTFCSNPGLLCVVSYSNGAKCVEDRQCLSNNCLNSKSICSDGEDYNHFPIWGYILIGIGILATISALILILYLRRRRRNAEYKKAFQENDQIEPKSNNHDALTSSDPNEFVTIIPEPRPA